MTFLSWSLQEISIENIKELVINRVSRGQELEFKAAFNRGSSDDALDILRQVSSFANTNGGLIIVGIQDDGFGHAETIHPIDNLEETLQEIKIRCTTGISDPIEGLETRSYEVSRNSGLIAILVPSSNFKPHKVAAEKQIGFYRRGEFENYAMSIDEIRSHILSNPINKAIIESELLASGKVIRPGQTEKKSGPHYVRIFTENSVDQFIKKYFACTAFPQTLVIVSPFISDLAGELIKLKDMVSKINKDKTITYVITRPPKEQYQWDGISLLQQSPFIEIRYNDDIHAKLYLCWCRKSEQASFAMFGSGNLTSGGVRQNLELGMMIFSKEHGRNLINRLYQWSTCDLRTKSQIKKSIKYS